MNYGIPLAVLLALAGCVSIDDPPEPNRSPAPVDPCVELCEGHPDPRWCDTNCHGRNAQPDWT